MLHVLRVEKPKKKKNLKLILLEQYDCFTKM